MTHAWTLWTRSLLGASIGLSAMIWASTSLGQLPVVPAVPAVPADPAPAVEPAKSAAKDVTDAAKDTAKDVKNTAKDAAQPVPGAVRDAARDAREGVRDTARDAREGVRDTTRDARGTVQDAREGVRDTARDARGTVQDAREGVRDTVRDARDAAGNTVRDVRGTVRDARGSVNASGRARANLRWQDLQSADVGLWFNRNANDGLIIADVGTQGPIAKLGFEEGDRIVSVNGQTIARQADFMQHLFSSKVADGRVAVIINRGGQQQTFQLEPQAFLTHVNSYQDDRLEQIGIVGDDRVTDRVVVWRVTPRSPAYFAGLRSGDVIVNFNKQPVSTWVELSQFATKAEAGAIALEVQRGDKTRQLEVDFQAEAHSALRPNLDNEGDAPSLESSVRTPVANGNYNNSGNYNNRGYNSGRRGFFRGRR